MTREQAIDLLDNLIGFVEDSQGSDYDEALKLAIKALKQEPKWIPIKYEYPYMYDCPLPDDGQDVFITTCRGDVTVDTFCRDYKGCYFKTYCDDSDVVAWMPLPEPYKAESEE